MLGFANLKINKREFTATLNRYRLYSKRDPEIICDTKAFYIARRATVETSKADHKAIKRQLGRIVKHKDGTKSLRLKKSATRKKVSLAEAILRARIWKKGGVQPTRAEMQDLIESMILARLRSIAFLKSGWIPAIKRLEPLAEKRGAPRMDRKAGQYGVAKGYAKPAGLGWITKTIIGNTARAATDRGIAIKRLTKGLQAAFDFERQSMLAYIERKLRATAQRAGVKVK